LALGFAAVALVDTAGLEPSGLFRVVVDDDFDADADVDVDVDGDFEVDGRFLKLSLNLNFLDDSVL
jgi:hypothetical protein